MNNDLFKIELASINSSHSNWTEWLSIQSQVASVCVCALVAATDTVNCDAVVQMTLVTMSTYHNRNVCGKMK